EEVRGKKGSLVPAFRALDLDHDVAVVVRILGQEQDLQLFLELGYLLGCASLLRPHVLLHLHVLLVPEHLARRLHLRARAAVGVIGLDDLWQGALLPRQPGHLLVVGGNLRPPHLLLDLAITARDRFQTVNHFVFPALPALPGSAWQPPLNSVETAARRPWGVPHKGGLPPLCLFSRYRRAIASGRSIMPPLRRSPPHLRGRC